MLVTGYMVRKCIDVDGEPTWGRPNFEHCVSQAMKNIFNEVLVKVILIKKKWDAFRITFQNHLNLWCLAITRVLKDTYKNVDKTNKPQIQLNKCMYILFWFTDLFPMKKSYFDIFVGRVSKKSTTG